MADKEFRPQITKSEAKIWEDKFREKVSNFVRFTSDENGESTLKLYNGISGIEAKWSGSIILSSDNHIDWKFSLHDGVFIDAKYNLDIDTKDLMSSIFDLYLDWRNSWSKALVTPPAQEAPVQEMPVGQEQPEMPLQESRRTKEDIINNFSDRMRSLAGIYSKK
jgi:hypothetical protein